MKLWAMLHYSLEEKYESLKDMLAYYLVLQFHTFIKTSGERQLKKAMKVLTEKAAEINSKDASHFNKKRHAEILGIELAGHMGETFSSLYKVEKKNNEFTVTIKKCGCANSIKKQAKNFNLSRSSCKTVFCGSCMEGYRLSAERLGLKFKGILTKQGCRMSFAYTEAA